MKKLLLCLTIVFGLVGLAGVAYVLVRKGEVNAGYAVIPMLFCIICGLGYAELRNRDKRDR